MERPNIQSPVIADKTAKTSHRYEHNSRHRRDDSDDARVRDGHLVCVTEEKPTSERAMNCTLLFRVFLIIGLVGAFSGCATPVAKMTDTRSGKPEVVINTTDVGHQSLDYRKPAELRLRC
jgi:hypothetical protein